MGLYVVGKGGTLTNHGQDVEHRLPYCAWSAALHNARHHAQRVVQALEVLSSEGLDGERSGGKPAILFELVEPACEIRSVV